MDPPIAEWMAKVSHFLVDSDNLTSLQLPVGASLRIKVIIQFISLLFDIKFWYALHAFVIE
jgi:hypothetical protein